VLQKISILSSFRGCSHSSTESGADAIVATPVDAQGSVRCGQVATESTKKLQNHVGPLGDGGGVRVEVDLVPVRDLAPRAVKGEKLQRDGLDGRAGEPVASTFWSGAIFRIIVFAEERTGRLHDHVSQTEPFPAPRGPAASDVARELTNPLAA